VPSASRRNWRCPRRLDLEAIIGLSVRVKKGCEKLAETDR
jgi:hypothetical protein